MSIRRGLIKISGSFALVATAGLSCPSWATETVTYTYDARGRLVTVKSTGSVNNNQTHSYCYDKEGNRIKYVASQTGVPDSCVTTG